jgi:7-cyano-7-deazaguanine reductase
MRRDEKQVLGEGVSGPIGAEELATVPWSYQGKDAVVEFSTDELTALCPVTGQPDFYELTLRYCPGEALLESKALKLYLWGFREKGVFGEELAATLLDDLVAACDPVWMELDLTQRVRGGLQIHTTVRHPGS